MLKKPLALRANGGTGKLLSSIKCELIIYCKFVSLGIKRVFIFNLEIRNFDNLVEEINEAIETYIQQ